MKDPLAVYDFFCDYCQLPSFTEVYSSKEGTWSYMCLIHFLWVKLWKKNYGWSIAEWLTRIPFVTRLWNWWAK